MKRYSVTLTNPKTGSNIKRTFDAVNEKDLLKQIEKDHPGYDVKINGYINK